MKKILHLTLKKKWFDLIASGQKKIEYREYKPYWIRRLVHQGFTEVWFKNGYSKNAPFLKIALLRILFINSSEHDASNGEELTADKYFALYLGDVLEIRRWEENETK